MNRLFARILLSMVALSSLAATCGGPDDAAQGGVEIRVDGSAPLHKGGRVRAFPVGDPGAQIGEAKIDEAGAFVLPIRRSAHPIVLEAVGGTYREPAYEFEASHEGEPLRAALVGDPTPGTVQVAITPWSEIAVSATAQGGLTGYSAYIAAHTASLTCNQDEHRGLLTVRPAIPTKTSPISSLKVESLAYLYLGAWSQLTADLSASVGYPAGSRLTSMSLARALSEDAADGQIDGKKGDAPLFLLGKALEPDILRQPFAQALRHFLANERSDTSLPESTLLNVLGCASMGADTLFGARGQALDVNGPKISFRTPDAEAYVSAPQQLACEAFDESGVVELHGTLWSGEQPIALEKPSLSAPDSLTQGWRTRLRTDTLKTGALTFRCEAKDRWGNVGRDERVFHVNHGTHAPTLSLNAHDFSALRDEVVVTCDCSGDPYTEACDLSAPKVEPSALTHRVTQDGRATYLWETADGLDGPYDLTCQNWTRGIDGPVATPASVYVKNVESGTVEGRVYLDTRVQHVTVTAYAFPDGERRQALGRSEAPNGDFNMTMATSYRGPVLLEAAGSTKSASTAVFENVPLNANVSIQNTHLTLLLDHYEPGESITGLSINIASSIAESLAVGLWTRPATADTPTTFRGAMEDAYALVSQYLLPSNPLDFRRTYVGDLRSEVKSAAADAETILGLFHVGLSRLAIEYSIGACGSERRSCITAGDILTGLREDLKDGVLDGRSPDQPNIVLGHGVVLNQDLLRIELARAIRRWLDKDGYRKDPLEAHNKSGLKAETYKRHFLQSLADNNSALFGREGVRYDEDGPELTITVFGPNNDVVNLTGETIKTFGDVTLRVLVDAKDDDSGVQWVTASTSAGQEFANLSRTPERSEFSVTTRDIPDGLTTLIIESRDGQGNPSRKEWMFRVDKVPPKLTVPAEVWVQNGNAYQVRGVVSKPRVTGQIFEDGVALGSPWSLEDGTTAFVAPPVALECDATHTIAICVRDMAGNSNEAQQRVYCDSKRPSISSLPSPFTSEKTNAVQDLSVLFVHGSSNGDAPDPNFQMEKIWSGLDRGAANLPTFNFAINDIDSSGVGTPSSLLKVEYKYLFGNGGAGQERGWTQIECKETGCSVTFSYQDMLPKSVLEQPLVGQRAANFIARSRNGDIHTIVVRVRDQAGNESLAHWSFHLHLLSPSVSVECDFHEEARATNLHPTPSVQQLAQTQAHMLSVTARTEFSTLADSLTPNDGEICLTFNSSAVEWRLEKTLQQVYRLRHWDGPPPLPWSDCPNGEWKRANIFSDGCTADARGHRDTYVPGRVHVAADPSLG